MPDDKILFVSTRLSHPITAMRVDMLEMCGFEVDVVGFDRPGFYGRLPSGPYAVLGRLVDGNYLRRLPGLLRAVPRLRRAISRSSLIYANGADVAFVASLARRGGKPLVREVPDIEPILFSPGLKGPLYRWLDKRVESRCALLVLSASGYRTYYRDWLRLDTPSIVVENRVDPDIASAWRDASAAKGSTSLRVGTPLADRPMRLGWFGQIQNPWSLDLVEHVIRTAGDRFEIVIAGAIASNIGGFDRFLDQNPSVEYLGAYRHPHDLPRLYEQIDMQLTCYDPEIPNGWSRSCRFFDACALGTPMIVREGTADAALVGSRQLGAVLRHTSPLDAASELAGMTSEDWIRWQANIDALTPDVYCHADEPAELAAALRKLC